MMPELLAHHTSMTVVQAGDGMRLQREHLYIIPPGTYLSVGGGALLVARPRLARATDAAAGTCLVGAGIGLAFVHPA